MITAQGIISRNLFARVNYTNDNKYSFTIHILTATSNLVPLIMYDYSLDTNKPADIFNKIEKIIDTLQIYEFDNWINYIFEDVEIRICNVKIDGTVNMSIKLNGEWVNIGYVDVVGKPIVVYDTKTGIMKFSTNTIEKISDSLTNIIADTAKTKLNDIWSVIKLIHKEKIEFVFVANDRKVATTSLFINKSENMLSGEYLKENVMVIDPRTIMVDKVLITYNNDQLIYTDISSIVK